MTRPSTDLFVTTHELGLGLARRPCSYCASPLMIRLPSMADAIRDQESHAIRLGITDLSPTGRHLFDVLYDVWPRAMSTPAILTAMDDMDPHNLHVVTTRLRASLKVHGWLLLQFHGSLRLVEPVPIV